VLGSQLWKSKKAKAAHPIVHAYEDMTVPFHKVCRIINRELASGNVQAVTHDPTTSMNPDNDGNIASIRGSNGSIDIEVQAIFMSKEGTTREFELWANVSWLLSRPGFGSPRLREWLWRSQAIISHWRISIRNTLKGFNSNTWTIVEALNFAILSLRHGIRQRKRSTIQH